MKLFYDAYRRRRQRTEELEQMATRPFGSILLQFDDIGANEIDKGLKIANEDVFVASAEMIGSGKCLISTVALLMPACTENNSTMQQQGTLALGSCLFINRKPPEMAKPTEPKQQPKKLKVLFKKGSRLRSTGGRAPNARLSTQNNCSSTHGDEFTSSSRENNRTEGALAVS